MMQSVFTAASFIKIHLIIIYPFANYFANFPNSHNIRRYRSTYEMHNSAYFIKLELHKYSNKISVWAVSSLDVVEFEDFDGNDDVLDMRASQVMGGTFTFDLLNMPPQPKNVNNWTLNQSESYSLSLSLSLSLSTRLCTQSLSQRL